MRRKNETGVARLWRIQFKATAVGIKFFYELLSRIIQSPWGCVASLAIMLLVHHT